MSKKKNLLKKSLKILLRAIYKLIAKSTIYKIGKEKYFFQNIFRITMSFKQLFFSMLNVAMSFVSLFSTGQILPKPLRKFKFFKKSNSNINPLVLTMRFSFVDFFQHLYLIECLNYSKKQYMFLKKLLSSITSNIKFMIFRKTWQYTTQPVKRIKRRVLKMLKNI